MKRLCLYLSMFLTCLILAGCVELDENGKEVERKEREKKKDPVVTYAIQYVIHYDDFDKTIIEHIKVDADKNVGLFYYEEEENGINRLVLKGDGNSYYKQEICATRHRISSYGVSYWTKE